MVMLVGEAKSSTIGAADGDGGCDDGAGACRAIFTNLETCVLLVDSISIVGLPLIVIKL